MLYLNQFIFSNCVKIINLNLFSSSVRNLLYRLFFLYFFTTCLNRLLTRLLTDLILAFHENSKYSDSITQTETLRNLNLSFTTEDTASKTCSDVALYFYLIKDYSYHHLQNFPVYHTIFIFIYFIFCTCFFQRLINKRLRYFIRRK